MQVDLKKLTPTAITTIGTLVALFTPKITAILVAHPKIAIVGVGLYTILQGLLPTPIKADLKDAITKATANLTQAKQSVAQMQSPNKDTK